MRAQFPTRLTILAATALTVACGSPTEPQALRTGPGVEPCATTLAVQAAIPLAPPSHPGIFTPRCDR